MATGAPGAAHGSVPGGHASPVEQWAAKRQVYLDNLKVILIAAIIAGHAILGYTAFDWWSYADVREISLSPVTAIALLVLVAPFGLLMIPLLFLVAGLQSRPSVERKGPGRFARDRLLRLGIPFAVFALVLWPLLEYALFRVMGTVSASFWAYLRAEGSLDTGVLWFVGVLLIFSLAYAAWVRMRGGDAGRAGQGEIHAGHLMVLVAGVTVATFLLRLVVRSKPTTATWT